MSKAASSRCPRVLYLGDVQGASARYLVGVLSWLGYPCTHLDMHQSPPAALHKGKRPFDVIVLSDYPYERLGRESDARIARLVHDEGVGLVMLGGWSSFTGLNGGYRGSQVAAALPVRMADEDDRRNVPSGLVAWPSAGHALVDGLSFRRPPVIMGYNAVLARSTSTVVLSAWEMRFRGRGKTPVSDLGAARPLLVIGQHGAGHTAAFTTDVAPHWCGGLVDWGRGRIRAGDAEVGEVYVEFIRRLLTFAAFGESAL